MWKGIIRKGASYEENFVSKNYEKDFSIYIRSPKNVDIVEERAILEWTGSIEVYSAGFGALSSSSNKLELEIQYIKMGDDELEEEYITKEFVFTGNFEDDGRGNPEDITVDMDFSDFNNPKITKVEVIYEGRFNEMD